MKNKLHIKTLGNIVSMVVEIIPFFVQLKRININSWFKCSSIVFILLFAHVSSANIYSDTIEQIKTIYSKSNTHTHTEFLNLDIIKDSSKFKNFLKEISENDQGALLKVTGYYHPVGFIKIIIYKGSKGEQLRLHFWGKGGGKAIHQDFNNGWEPIHNHRWNFSSKVIKGGLRMKEYTDFDPRIRFNNIKEAQSELIKLNKNYKIYDVSIIPTKQTNTDYRVIKTGKYALIGNYVNKYVGSNNSYWLDHITLHQVKSEKDTSTILLMDPPAKLFASEIFSNNDEFQEEVELQNLTHKEVQTYIKEFLDDLNGRSVL